ncbi:MAG: aldehyde dehydrogenase family protein [Alcaligenaceae bacterium]|nr:aldehyde dehydrogenase family protein [Alcaligenaceae bacterium SAGV5]MPS51479.1 aldehyde dehydrogenase family protein [Alcaligenaceae bacterium SAGV3]MPT59709.1 aldehyde dehydrogenase family protein [Alcaligenaceae bacterium]
MTNRYHAGLIVAGALQETGAAQVLDNINPANGELVGTVATADAATARAAIGAARQAFEDSAWAGSPRLRQDVLLQWARNLAPRAQELAMLLTRENGKVIAQSAGEMHGAISEINYYAGLARYIAGNAQEVSPGVLSTQLREPAGVAGIIVPWNAPALLLVRSLAPALAAGCTTVIKPAWQTALVTCEMLKELINIPGLPPGVVNMVVEDGADVSQLICQSDDVDVISFTGSNETGQRIYASAAPTMKKLSLELGDKASCIVFDDAPIPDVMRKIADAATIISGQQCTAARRVLVHADAYDAARAHLRDALAALKAGPGWLPGHHLGPLIDRGSRDRVQSQIHRAMNEADEVLLEGSTLESAHPHGAFLTPSLVAHGDTSAFFVQQEIFGPFVVLEKFHDEAEAVARANHTVYGLSSSVWTRDGARAQRVARKLRRGTVWINDHNKLMAEAETGGYRRSGLGRLHGHEALNDFTESKIIYQDSNPL